MSAIINRPRIKFFDSSVVSTYSPSRFSIEIKGGKVSPLSGKPKPDDKKPKEGVAGEEENVEKSETVVAPAQTVKVDFGTIDLGRFNGIVSVNPDLFLEAQTCAPTFLLPGKANLVLTVTARKKLDLKDYSHLLSISLID